MLNSGGVKFYGGRPQEGIIINAMKRAKISQPQRHPQKRCFADP